ncbi:MAG: hypothetical protein Q9222_007821 [Ikaeria aurantiellina]
MSAPDKGIDEDTRQSVRSFVMRKYVAEQKRRQTQSSCRQRPVRIEMASPVESSSSDGNEKEASVEKWWLPRFVADPLNTGCLDDFCLPDNTLPRSGGHDMQGISDLESPTESTCDESLTGSNDQSRLAIRHRQVQKRPGRRSGEAEKTSRIQSKAQERIIRPLTPTLFSGALDGDQEVLHYCSTVVAESMIPLDKQIDPMHQIWLPAVSSDPLVRHTILFRESSELHATDSGEEHPLTITHRMMTVRLLNKRLASGPKGCDELAMATIGALAGAAVSS